MNDQPSIIDACLEAGDREAERRERVRVPFLRVPFFGGRGPCKGPCVMQANRRKERRRRKAVNAACGGQYRNVLRRVRKMIRDRGCTVLI